MSQIALADIYYKIEDKWFDLLDWLEAHHIPVYKLVDPLEKRGIPSLPVFVAFLLILVYLLAVLLGGIGARPAGNFHIEDYGTGDCIPNVHLKFTDGQTYETDAGSDCKAYVNLPPGEYTLEVSKEGCENVTTQVVLKENTQNMAAVSMICGNPADKVNLCFDPEEVGIVNVLKYKGILYAGKINNCGIDKCSFYVEDGITYGFESSKDYESTDEYTAEELKSMSSKGTCVPMKGAAIIKPRTGKVTIEVRGNNSELVPGVRVKLVNPIDTSGIIASDITGYNGSSLGVAYFEKEIGTTFKIKVEAGNNTGAYAGTQTYNFTEEPQFIRIVLAQSLITKLTVLDKDTGYGVGNVLVTFYEKPEENVSTYTRTYSDGNVSIGLKAGKSYKVTFWRIDYDYSEDSINAGDAKTFRINKAREDENGRIDVSVYFENDGPVEGAILTLQKNDKPLGIPADPTGRDGTTSFENVPPGEYCIKVSRPNAPPTDCDDNRVTVVAGETTNKEITIRETKFTLEVIVTKDGSSVRNATVTVVEDYGAFTMTGTTNTFGKANFSIPETNNGVTVSVFYKAANGEVFNVVQHLTKITGKTQVSIVLVASGNRVNLVRVESLNRDEIDITTEKLNAGQTYRFIFALGIYNIQGSKPDIVKFTTHDNGAYLEFLPEETFDWLKLSSSVPTQTMEYAAQGDFKYDTVVYLEVPVRVKQVFNGTMYHNFSFKGYWSKDSVEIRDPADGGYKNTPVLTLQAGFCKKYGDFGVCKYLLIGGQQKDPNSFTSVILDQFNIGMEITNEGRSYSGQFEVNDSKLNVIFSDATIQKLSGSTITKLGKYENYVPYEHRMVVNSPQAVTLEHGDVMKIVIPVKVVSPPRSQIVLTAGSQNLGNISFEITGMVKPEIKFSLQPTLLGSDGLPHFYDLTGDMPFKFVENESGVDIIKSRIWSDISSVSRVGGSGLTCTTINLRDSERSVDHVFDTPDFYVALDKGCRINASGVLKVEIAQMKDVKDASWTYNTESCLKFPSKSQMFTNMMSDQPCEVQYIFSTREQGVEQPLGGVCTTSTPTKVYVKTCEELVTSVTIDPFVSSQLIYDRNVADASASGTTVTFTYKGTKDGDMVNLSTIVTARSKVEYTGVELSSSYVLPNMTFTVKKSVQAGPVCDVGTLWMAQKIQNYDKPLNCYENFCNIEQVLNYVKAESSDFLPGTVRFKMVNQQLTPQIIMAVWKEMFPGLTVMVAEKTYTGPEKYIIDSNTLNVPRKGYNVAKLEETSDKAHIFITFANELDSSLDTIDYIQLDILNQQKFGTIDKLKTKVAVDLQTVPSDKQTEVKNALIDVIRDSWNLPYTEPSGSNNVIVAEICQIDLLPPTQVCLNMRERNGNTNTSGVYKEVSTAGTTIHFVANGTQQLLDLIRGFKEAVKNPSTIGIMMYNKEKTYLSVAPPECSQQAPPDITLCVPGRMDLVFMEPGEKAIDIFDYETIPDKVTESTIKVRLSNPYLDGMQKIKIADIIGSSNGLFDGKSEIMAFVKTDDPEKQYRIVVLQDNDGSAVPSPDYYHWPVAVYYDLETSRGETYKDFAVIDWNGDKKADIALLGRDDKGNNRVLIVNNSYLIEHANGSIRPYIAIEVDDNEDISVLKAFQKDGYQMIMITERGWDDVDNHFVSIIKNSTEMVKNNYITDVIVSKGLYKWFEFHRECADVGIKDNKQLVCLLASGIAQKDNDIFVFNLDGLPENGDTVELSDSCSPPCSAWINTDDSYAKYLCIADFDSDGKTELLQAFFSTIFKIMGKPIDVHVYGPGTSGYEEEKFVELPKVCLGVNCPAYVSIYFDVSAMDWETNCGPRVA